MSRATKPGSESDTRAGDDASLKYSCVVGAVPSLATFMVQVACALNIETSAVGQELGRPQGGTGDVIYGSWTVQTLQLQTPIL